MTTGTRLPKRAMQAEAWRYHCRAHGVHAVVYYPIGFKGHRAVRCPACDQFMEVVERPEEELEGNVIDFVGPRQAQILAERMKAIQSGNPMGAPPDATPV